MKVSVTSAHLTFLLNREESKGEPYRNYQSNKAAILEKDKV